MTNELMNIINNSAFANSPIVSEIQDYNNPNDGVTIWFTEGNGLNYKFDQDDHLVRTWLDNDGNPIVSARSSNCAR